MPTLLGDVLLKFKLNFLEKISIQKLVGKVLICRGNLVGKLQ
jgi:hypothetical protein